MTDWQVIFLGVMAFSLVAMAAAQLVMALSLMKAVKQVSEAIVEIKRDVKPLVDNANRIAEDASRVVALAVVQAERIDQLIKSTTERVDDTFGLLQSAVVQPLRQGTAILEAVKAAFGAMRAWQGRTPTSREDEDPLFVG